MAQPKEHRYTLADLSQYAFKQGSNIHQVYEQWMDYIIECFSPKYISSFQFEQHMKQQMEAQPLFGQLMLQWLIDNTEAQDRGEMLDWFGQQYEEQLKSKSKAESLGQFYTPMHLCRLMARINGHDLPNPETVTVDDSACGSGRLLIAMEEIIRHDYGYSNNRYYTGADIDPMSVRMCALNLMVAGVCGQVLCRDTLRMETFYGYEINEVRYPMAVPLYSIRRITPDEAAALTYARRHLHTGEPQRKTQTITIDKQQAAREVIASQPEPPSNDTITQTQLPDGQLTLEF